SLCSLCARSLVSDHGRARQELRRVPDSLLPLLLGAALRGDRPLVAGDLVRAWPFPVLDLAQVLAWGRAAGLAQPSAPCMQACISALTRRREGPEGRGGPRSPCALRLLDLTGLPDEETETALRRTMNSWSRSVALAKAVLDVTAGGKRKPGARRPRVVLHANLLVNASSYETLLAALQSSGRAGSALGLRCRDLRVEELSLRRLCRLLEALEALEAREPALCKLDLGFNNMGVRGLAALLPRLARFPRLRSLSLAYSNVDVRRLAQGTPERGEEAFGRVAEALASLGALRELNLEASRLSDRVHQLLADIAPLESLGLAYCSLTPGDMASLTASHHTESLRCLDISGSNLGQLIPGLCSLLGRTTARLQELSLIGCGLADHHIPALLAALPACQALQQLRAQNNPLSLQALLQLTTCLASLPGLQAFYYPVPLECYVSGLAANPLADQLLEHPVQLDSHARAHSDLSSVFVSLGKRDVLLSTTLYPTTIHAYGNV
uniref:Si:ch73-174h16.4 n=1 Tax=Petromyzon marinus TaxID=7757 RepID=S4RL22_PETMA